VFEVAQRRQRRAHDLVRRRRAGGGDAADPAGVVPDRVAVQVSARADESLAVVHGLPQGPIAAVPRSPVRMRTQSSSARTTIFPSPTVPVGPVRAECTMASTAASTNASLTAISSLSLGSSRTWYSAPR